MRRLDGGHNPESGIPAVASFPLPPEKMAFGSIVRSGGSLHRMDFIWLRRLSAVSTGNGNSAALFQGD